MRLKILGGIVLTIVALVLSVASADASYYMRYGQAKNASRETAERVCRNAPECTGWGVGQCARRSSSRFDCVIGERYLYIAERTGTEFETECDSVLHWGVNIYGYIVLKGTGEPDCYEV
jgi:hypothetical protein